jgi:hypothetical protein
MVSIFRRIRTVLQRPGPVFDGVSRPRPATACPPTPPRLKNNRHIGAEPHVPAPFLLRVNGMKIQEQRLQPRFSLNLQVKISAKTADGSDVLREETIAANISSGGAFIITDRQIPLASIIDMEFFLTLEDLKKLQFILSVESLRACREKHVWVKAAGVVIRAEQNGVAIIFDTDYTIRPMSPSGGR